MNPIPLFRPLWRGWRPVAAGLLAGMLAGCASNAEVRHPRSSDRLVFSPEHPAVSVGMDIACELVAVLPGPKPGSTDVWEIVSNNRLILEQRDSLHYHPGDGPDGIGTTTVAFYTLKPGKSLLRFVLVHPHEEETTSSTRYEALVTVKNLHGNLQ